MQQPQRQQQPAEEKDTAVIALLGARGDGLGHQELAGNALQIGHAQEVGVGRAEGRVPARAPQQVQVTLACAGRAAQHVADLDRRADLGRRRGREVQGDGARNIDITPALEADAHVGGCALRQPMGPDQAVSQ